MASGLDINGCVLSYFEGTANLHCYTSCTLTILHCSKVSFLQCCHMKIYNKIFTKMFIITRDFNKADLRRIAPKFFQDCRPLLLPLPEYLQVPPPPTSRQIRSLFHSAPACLQAEVETGNTCPQDDSALVGPIGFYVTGVF